MIDSIDKMSNNRLTSAELCLSIKNLPLPIAEKIIKANGYDYRISCQDGVSKCLTSDYRPDRINISLMANVVFEVTKG
jgi:hypothetical protein